MLSLKIRNLATMLLRRPELADAVALQLDEIADCASHLDQASIAPAVLAAGITPLPANVIRFPVRA